MHKGGNGDTQTVAGLVRDLLSIMPDDALLARLRRAARDEDQWVIRGLAGVQPAQFDEMCREAVLEFLESRVKAYADAQRRKVRIRRNLPGRWVLFNYKLLADFIGVPAGVGVQIDWVKPSITVLELPGGGKPPDLDLEKVLNMVLQACGMNPAVPVQPISAHSLASGNEPDKLDPPPWTCHVEALLGRFAFGIPLAGDLHQIYREMRAKLGRRVALSIYCRLLLRTITYGSSTHHDMS